MLNHSHGLVGTTKCQAMPEALRLVDQVDLSRLFLDMLEKRTRRRFYEADQLTHQGTSISSSSQVGLLHLGDGGCRYRLRTGHYFISQIVARASKTG